MHRRFWITPFALFVLTSHVLPQTAAVEEEQLLSSDLAAGDAFGIGVGVSGDRAVIGAHEQDGAGTDAGAAYVYVRSGSSWTQQARLEWHDTLADDSLGAFVAIDGDTLLIGAPGDDNQGGVDAGAAYVFVWDGANWKEQQKLTANDKAAGDFFGSGVSLSGDTAVIGAIFDDNAAGTDAGAAYVFRRTGTAWLQDGKLLPADLAPGDFFGLSTAIDGDRAVVGAHVHDTGGLTNAGAAYVFVRAGSSWSEEAKLTAADAELGDRFGEEVTLSGTHVVVGAPFKDGNTMWEGAAYGFTLKGGIWVEEAKLTASDAEVGDFFGIGVSLDGDTLVVGAYTDDDFGINSGAAYVFLRQGTSWVEQDKFVGSGASSDDLFGAEVSVSADTVVAGAYLDDPGGLADAGSAYAFRLTPKPPVTYCTSGTSAGGCSALIYVSGMASATAGSGFTIGAVEVEGTLNGQFFYGTGGRQANPWGTGTSYQCVVPPVKRGGATLGRGTSGACDGAFAQDLNARWCPTCPKPQHNPGAGAVVQAQLWYRDPSNTSNQTTSFSHAVEFCVGP